MSLRDIVHGLASRLTLSPRGRSSTFSDRVLRSLSAYERELWTITLGAMLVDVTLTVHGLQLGLKEMNPIGRVAIEYAGVLGLYALKIVALGMGVCCAFLIPDRYTALVPLGLAIPSLFAVIVNSTLIAIVLL